MRKHRIRRLTCTGKPSSRSAMTEQTRSRRDFLRSSCLGAAGSIALAFPGLLPPAQVAQRARGSIWIYPDEILGVIHPNIYGHMAEHVGRLVYDGIWVGENSAVPNEAGLRKEAVSVLRRLKAPVMRWPGGCYADAYHWEDGVGPREKRPTRWSVWWETQESNAFGTDEFLRFCGLVGAAPYVSVNVGSGSVPEALHWLEYCNSGKDTAYTRMRAANGHAAPYGVRYWGIGNETWGCGGLFKPDDYAREYLRYALYFKHWFWPSTGLSAIPVELIAVGHTAPDWNQVFLEEVRNSLVLLDHLSIHHYFRLRPDQPLNAAPGAVSPSGDIQFSDGEYYLLLSRLDELKGYIEDAVVLLKYYVAGRKKVGLIVDEWGTWHPQATFETGFSQQNTLRDAIMAGSVLNLLNSRCQDISMANIAQSFNVLQAVGLTKGAQVVLTPTFYAMEMFVQHQGSKLLRSRIQTPSYQMEDGSRRMTREAVNISASLNGKHIFLTAVNEDLAQDIEFQVGVQGANIKGATGRRLWSEDVREHNTFENPEQVKTAAYSPVLKSNDLRVELPAHSVSAIDIELV